MGRSIEIAQKPIRIISLVPSQTELLHYFGLEEEVIGITKFCVHPKTWHQTKTRIGGTKNIDFGKIDQLQPDLIIGNKEENNEADILKLAEKYPVWMSDVNTLPDALDMIDAIGKITKREIQSKKLIKDIHAAKSKTVRKQKTAIYLIWKDPYMAVGNNTFIGEILNEIGIQNLVTTSRYPEITIEEIQQLQPDLLLLSTEPYPFATNHLNAINKELKNIEVQLVDGEMFSWYGSRLVESFTYFNEIFK